MTQPIQLNKLQKFDVFLTGIEPLFAHSYLCQQILMEQGKDNTEAYNRFRGKNEQALTWLNKFVGKSKDNYDLALSLFRPNKVRAKQFRDAVAKASVGNAISELEKLGHKVSK